ncbi:hypothetical protein [Candidatus Neptunochlamydia vexilliferae]|uniref:Transposase n=1 Tax=Candidatus Neptunichlamydia vexilliferae TaxID=1651774 RepID=A0ABS0B024_9BACT|nr:hypothetical protein [Candidatus Neptunochlamydia vexilliferae]MBF5058930.1 hypothetical protein [Candidatus Neptunochlamydia vexilliferae]
MSTGTSRSYQHDSQKKVYDYLEAWPKEVEEPERLKAYEVSATCKFILFKRSSRNFESSPISVIEDVFISKFFPMGYTCHQTI